MLGSKWLTRQWNAWKENRRIKAQHEDHAKQALGYIKADDIEGLQELFDRTDKKDTFIRKNFNAFIKEAINADNIDTFEFLLADTSSGPNYQCQDAWHMPEISTGHTSVPVLILALKAKAEKIATSLADNPKTNIYKTEHQYRSYYRNGERQVQDEYGEKPSELAEYQGMSEIAAKLMRREAADLTAKATELNKTAAPA